MESILQSNLQVSWSDARRVDILVRYLQRDHPTPPHRTILIEARYEFYYDCIQRGQFIYKIRDLHEQYGPIIRINPHELHVADPAFYHTLYAAGSQKRNRDPYHASSLTLNGSVLASPDCSLHRKRRAALSPFFSAQNTRRLLPLVQERVEVLVAKLEELKDTGKIVNLLHAYAAFSNGQ